MDIYLVPPGQVPVRMGLLLQFFKTSLGFYTNSKQTSVYMNLLS